MKAIIALSVVAVVLFLAGCSDKMDSPVTPQQKQTGLDLSKKHEVPFQTTMQGVTHNTMTGPYSAHAEATGSGNATHVGYYTSTSSDDIYFTGPGTGIIVNGKHTSYTASGDEMYATFTGTFVVANGIVTSTIDFIFDGGTGRFTNLYGEVHAVITSDDVGQLAQEMSGSGSGYIIY